MGAGFVRRYGYFPGDEVITLIEGVIIIDLPAPGQVNGVSVGTVALVGEFQDSSSGVSVDSSADVTSNPTPTEIFSGQDLQNKVGGFDETIGDFGGTMGNGFVELRNKTFSRLIVVATSLASAKAARIWRVLPTNVSATSANPVVPMQPALVPAGRQFVSGSNRVRLAGPVTFTGDLPRATGIDGTAAPAGLPAATQNFSSASANFLTDGAEKGDALVVGVIGGAGAQGTDANTYRVVAVVDANNLTIERQDGSNFTVGNWVASAALAWRLHPGATADSGPFNRLSEPAGYLVPARPLDATIAAATTLTPSVVPPAATASSWDPLSGLEAITDPATGLVFTAAIQGPNAVSAAGIDALYVAAFDSLLGEASPQRDVNIVWAARKSANIRTKIKSHVLLASSVGVGRSGVISPDLSVQSIAAAISDSDPGVGANRDERVDYSWPGVTTFIPEAVNFQLKCADGFLTGQDKNHPAGTLDVTADGWLVSLLSQLAPERDPGQAAPPTPLALALISGLQRGAPNLMMTDYTILKQKGICAIRIDRSVGPVFQSGVTTSLTSGQTDINRRRFADFVEDSIAEAFGPLAKLPMSQDWKDTLVSEDDAFCNELLSPDNPKAQRIDAYQIDDVNGNTPDLEEKGIFVVITKVRMTPIGKFIVIQAEIGNGVVITKQT